MVRDRPRIQTRVVALSHPNSPCHSAPHIEESPIGLTTEPNPFVCRSRFPSSSGVNKRRQALLALLEDLSELKEEVESEKTYDVYPMIEDDRTFNNAEGVERFRAFDECIDLLVLKLQSFANAVRQLASSAGLLNATNLLRCRLPVIQRLFRDNASKLFDTIPGPTHITSTNKRRRAGSKRRDTGEAMQQNQRSTNVCSLPSELEFLAKDLETFVEHLNDVPEFIDESVHTTHGAVNISVTAFAKDLQYRASCLKEFKDRLATKDKVILGYINDLTEDLVLHTTCVRDSLNAFIEVGVPAIRYSQQRMATSLQNLSTVATFFSGVTATTIQFSFEFHGTLLTDLVNALWISSLVFSIASAINAQLAYHWRAAMYRSPKCYVPWWVLIWIVYTPLAFLVISAAAFSIGLCVFTYSSEQSPAVRAFVTYCTVATSSGLLFVGIWFAFERWTFLSTSGRRWLLDILAGHARNIWDSLIINVSGTAMTKFGCFKEAKAKTNRLFSRILTYLSSLKKGDRAPGAMIVELPESDTEAQRSRDCVTCSDFNSPKGRTNMVINDTPRIDYYTGRRGPPDSIEFNGATETGALFQVARIPDITFTPSGSHNPSTQNARFRAIVRRVIYMLRITPQPWPGYWADFSPPVDLMPSSSRDLVQNRLIPQRIRTYVPMLRTLHPGQLLDGHLGLVRHLQFSPDGKFLATCSWDRTALIWKVNSGPPMEIELMHSLVRNDQVGGLVSQVAWSPSGHQLLTRQRRCIRLWIPKTRVCWRTILREQDVQSITWMPRSGSKFVSVEWSVGDSESEAESYTCNMENIIGSKLAIIEVGSGINAMEEVHHLERLQVWDAQVMPDEQRVVCVATLLQSQTKNQPVNSRYEKRLLIYNFHTRQIESQAPLLQNVRNVMLTALGNYALISYENKAPPQTWRIDEVSEDGCERKRCKLSISQTYATKNPAEFAGPSFFGGPKDTFVLAAARAGHIYIWERSSGILLHTLTMPSSQELTSLAWNRKSPHQFMLAAAARDGTIRLWQTKLSRPSLVIAPGKPESEEPSPVTPNPLPGSYNRVRFHSGS